MRDDLDPLAAERHFFASLVSGDVKGLEQVLGEDFLLIDVMSGTEISRASLLAAVGSGQLKFEAIEPAEARVRFYGGTAVVTGRTQMHGRFGETPFAASSRYTHVFVEQQGRWRMVSAQGTQIAPD